MTKTEAVAVIREWLKSAYLVSEALEVLAPGLEDSANEEMPIDIPPNEINTTSVRDYFRAIE